VTAFNDLCASGLLAAARERGVSVPGGLSVVGYDDSHIAGLTSVALTTVAQDSARLAESALGLALSRVADASGVPPCREVVVPPRLVVRRTTAPVA
jgi:DNA-binding LacI/PurR family transcriptional regulator